MKRTRKWAFVKQEAVRLADLGLGPKDIAARLGKGVNRSTVQRWMASGKIRDTRKNARGAAGGSLPAFSRDIKPDAWAKTVRTDYALDSTDDQLVTLGEMMLSVSKDPLQPMSIRIQATARYQAIAKQLNLAVRGADAAPGMEPTRPKVPERRVAAARPTVDPREILKAVK